jgi:hypothetical protein
MTQRTLRRRKPPPVLLMDMVQGQVVGLVVGLTAGQAAGQATAAGLASAAQLFEATAAVHGDGDGDGDGAGSTNPAADTAPAAPTANPPSTAPGAITARLFGASEVPPTASDAVATLEARVDASTRVLTRTVSHSGLSGLITAAHFHGPALPGSNAPAVVPIKGKLTRPFTGSATLTPPQVADLVGGSWFLNLHTAAHPGGEVRGQVKVVP